MNRLAMSVLFALSFGLCAMYGLMIWQKPEPTINNRLMSESDIKKPQENIEEAKAAETQAQAIAQAKGQAQAIAQAKGQAQAQAVAIAKAQAVVQAKAQTIAQAEAKAAEAKAAEAKAAEAKAAARTVVNAAIKEQDARHRYNEALEATIAQSLKEKLASIELQIKEYVEAQEQKTAQERRHASLREMPAIDNERSIELAEIYTQGGEAKIKAEKMAREAYDRLKK